MLRELHITNLAVIAEARLELGEGLNCFTGETGAGKSLVLGAFEILLGLRSGGLAEMLRPGADEARVSGLFELRDPQTRSRIAALTDLAADDLDELLITRRVSGSGRSQVSLNGRPATAAMVRAVGELLVDVHGQHDHQYLLKPANQLDVLDAFAHLQAQRQRYRQLHDELRSLRERHEALVTSRSLRRQQLDLYEFQAGELDDARLVAGEYHELKSRHNLLSNLRRIQRDAGAAHAALYETDGSILERLQTVVHLLGELSELDAQLEPTLQTMRSATLALQEASFDLSRYVERLDLDPAELAEIEDRLNTINRLIAKYDPGDADDPVAGLLRYREELESEIRRLRSENEDLAAMQQQMSRLQDELEVLADELRRRRQAAAQKLVPQVEAQFRELGMAEASFSIDFADDPDAATGRDRLEMLVRTNPGQPARPLRKIASGGELSRMMLAIQSILAGADRVSVLVFDEIDANVGGRLGTVIGLKLRQLASSGAGHQVLCITHLPQIAAFADRHLRVAKAVTGKGARRQTHTTVTALDSEARIAELAEMLAGKGATKTSQQQAREMLAAAV